MSARLGRILLAAALALGCSPGAEPPAVSRVLLITVDTLRADRLGSYGSERAHTPHLDALAEAGTRFETAIAPTPLTLPSHTTILTGMDPPEHGVHGNSVFRLADDVPTLAERARDAGFATAAFLGAVVLDRQYGLARGFDRYDDQMDLRRASSVSGFAERTGDRVVDAALAWLEDAPDRFLLWLHLYDPHADYLPPPGFAAAFPRDPYAGEIAFADSQVGRLLERVRERWPDDATLVIATSDHGESLGEHGEATHGYAVYDATQRVPLILAGPGIPAGRVVAPPVALADVAPTVLAQLGLPPLPGATGRDLSPLLEGMAPPQASPPAYVETLIPRLDFGWSPSFGLRTAQHKYIRTREPELYDLSRDPGETRNLAAEQPERVAELDARLEARLAGLSPVRPSHTPDAADRARLESLGYVVADAETDPIVLGDVSGADTRQMMRTDWRRFGELGQMVAQGRGAEALGILDGIEGSGRRMELLRAQAALGAGLLDRAERHARSAIQGGALGAPAQEVLGQVLELQERSDEARAAYELALELDATSGSARVGLGRLAESEGDVERAAEHYRAASASRGRSAEGVWRLAALHIEAGEQAEADALLARLDEGTRLSPWAALRLAEAEGRSGRPDAARERIRRALADHEGNPALERALARLAELDG